MSARSAYLTLWLASIVMTAGGQQYRISGHAVNASTGAPLAGATVIISLEEDGRQGTGAPPDRRNQRRPTDRQPDRQQDRPPDRQPDRQPPNVVASFTTGEDGEFHFDHLGTNKYSLVGSKRGYLTSGYEQHSQFASAIVTGAGLESENLVLKLSPGAVIHGTVTDSAGDPIEQANVTLFRQQDDGFAQIRTYRSLVTDDVGGYEFAHVPLGTYFLGVNARVWYATPPTNETQVARSDLDVAYPLSYYADTTDSSTATPIPVKGGDRLVVDVPLHAVPAVHLSFPMPRVPSDGQARSDGFEFPVAQQLAFGNTVTARQPDFLPMPHTDHLGASVTMSMAPGQYAVEMNGRSVMIDASVDTRIDPVAGVAMGSVNGKLAMAGGTALPTGMDIALSQGGGQPEEQSRSSVAADGSFTLERVLPGEYEVSVTGNGSVYAITQMAAQGAQVNGALLKTSADAVTMAATIVLASGRITGYVRGGGKGIPGAMVVLVPKHMAETSLYRRDQSDSDGSFVFRQVAPGDYTVVSIENGWEMEWAKPAVIARYLAGGGAVLVKEGARLALKADVALQPR